MTLYYKGFDHTNSSDGEEEVTTITSTEAEPKLIKRVVVVQRLANDTNLYVYLEREKILDAIAIESSPVGNDPWSFPIDFKLPLGQTLTVKLKNQTAGSNGGIVGYIEYEITE